MEEEKTVVTTGEIEEQAEPQESAELENNQPAEEPEEAPTEEAPKKKSLKGLIQYIKTHENLRQPILFFLFSMICGGTQMLITLVLPIILRAAYPNTLGENGEIIALGKMSQPFKWFIFDYTEKGIGEFIGFLVGSFIGQLLTFVLNRKKTFNVHDHIPFRAIAYTIMAVLIILMQTAIGGGITGALAKAVPDANETVAGIFNIVAQAVAGIAALVVNFLGNKFFVMRKFGKYKDEDKAPAEDAPAEDSASVPAEEPKQAPEE